MNRTQCWKAESTAHCKIKYQKKKTENAPKEGISTDAIIVIFAILLKSSHF